MQLAEASQRLSKGEFTLHFQTHSGISRKVEETDKYCSAPAHMSIFPMEGGLGHLENSTRSIPPTEIWTRILFNSHNSEISTKLSFADGGMGCGRHGTCGKLFQRSVLNS